MLIIGDNQLGLVDENGNTQLIKGQHNVRIPSLAVGGHSPLPHASYPHTLLPSVELFPSTLSVFHLCCVSECTPFAAHNHWRGGILFCIGAQIEITNGADFSVTFPIAVAESRVLKMVPPMPPAV